MNVYQLDRNQLLPGTVEVNLGQPELTECGTCRFPGQMGG